MIAVLGTGTPTFVIRQIIKILIIRTPPEGVIDNGSTGYGRIFQPGTIEGHILGNTVNNHRITTGLSLHGLVYPYRFGHDSRTCLLFTRAIKASGKSVLFHAEFYFLHKRFLNMIKCGSSGEQEEALPNLFFREQTTKSIPVFQGLSAILFQYPLSYEIIIFETMRKEEKVAPDVEGRAPPGFSFRRK
jgi:hypothetical protein